MDKKSGLNFPPDHSTTAASLSASAVAAAAAAAAAATNNNPNAGNGLLANPISMQNLVTLASLNPGPIQSGHVAQGAAGGHHHNVPTSQALTFNAAQAHHHHQQQQQQHQQQQQQHQQHQANMAHLTAAHQMSLAGAAPPSLAAHFVAGPAAQHHALCEYPFHM